jgi:hypothetical protein
MSSETSHHWAVFAAGIAGACVEFDKDALLSKVKRDKKLRCGQVIYKKIPELRQSPPKVEELPFIKRHPYRDEAEYRIIYESRDESSDPYTIEITYAMIRRITLSPNMPKAVADNVRELIHSNSKLSSIRITHSKLLEYEEWKKMADRREVIVGDVFDALANFA